jgi:hypothetical protein
LLRTILLSTTAAAAAATAAAAAVAAAAVVRSVSKSCSVLALGTFSTLFWSDSESALLERRKGWLHLNLAGCWPR